MAKTNTQQSKEQRVPAEGWNITSPTGKLLATVGAGVGILIPVYLGTNPNLSGWRFLLAIVLAAPAIAFLFEGVHRARDKERWRVPCGIGVATAIASMLFAFLPLSSGEADAGDGRLRLSLRPTAPDLFHVALKRPIPMPGPDEGWAQLRQRGAVDVGRSQFHLILANQGSAPISVLDIHAEVLRSEPIPGGTEAWQGSQGDEAMGRLTVLLPDGEAGSTGLAYDSSARTVEPGDLGSVPSYFERKYITLTPGEVYPATLTVKADTPQTIRYRLVAEGETAERKFTVKTRPHRIVGTFEDPFQRRFTNYYMKGYLPTDCTATPENPWVDARNGARSEACPHGLGRSYEIPLDDPSRFPPKEFSLHLGLTPGRQSATVSGVVVGSSPAAASRPGVVLPLLRALGAWSSCSRYSPTPGYWSALWERWGLHLTFAGQGSTDCKPSSSAPVRQIELRESRELIQTDLGPIELGAPAAWLSSPIAEILTVGAESDYEQDLVAPGTSPCDPTRPDPTRTQLSHGRPPGGIVALHDSTISNELSGLTTTLPPAGC